MKIGIAGPSKLYKRVVTVLLLTLTPLFRTYFSCVGLGTHSCGVPPMVWAPKERAFLYIFCSTVGRKLPLPPMIPSARPTVTTSSDHYFQTTFVLRCFEKWGRTYGRKDVRKQWSLPAGTVGWSSGSKITPSPMQSGKIFLASLE